MISIGVVGSGGAGAAAARRWRRLVLEQQGRVLEAQMGAQRVDAAVRGRAVGAQRALRRVRVEVVPAVGHLLAAALAAPQRRALRRRHEHAMVRVLRPRALCNNAPRHATPHATRYMSHSLGGWMTTETTRVVTYHNLM